MVLFYFGEVEVNSSCLREGSVFGLGLAGFLVSLRPLSLFPISASMAQNKADAYGKIPQASAFGTCAET